MADPGGRRSATRRKNPGPRRAWCCSLGGVALQSPDRRSSVLPSKNPPKPPNAGSSHSSPSPSSKLGRGIIDPRRILSPGRVSPIDSDAPLDPVLETLGSVAMVTVESEPESLDPPPEESSLNPGRTATSGGFRPRGKSLDFRLSLKGKDGRCLVLELDSEVLCENSSFFTAMVLDSRPTVSGALADCGEIEVTEVKDLGVFRETIELMYKKDLMVWLMKLGVSRAIDILEVSYTIVFDRGVMSCLKYLEAVPWSESEEEKLKSLFSRCTFAEGTAQEVLARLGPQGSTNSEGLAVRLIQSVSSGTNGNARKEMQSLVNGLLSKSSVYQKDTAGLDKESLYRISHSCLNSLVELFEEASDTILVDRTVPAREARPSLVERISNQSENLNWLLEILIYHQMAEDFVGLWADQEGLIRMHGRSSPMVRYELSRISASVFVALGRGKLQCRGCTRLGVLRAWFGPMLADFGWLQRCSKGLDMRMLEESLGQALLTLPLKQQQGFFEEWFRCFAGQGTECPNLSKAFQVWWRRSFVRSSEARNQL